MFVGAPQQQEEARDVRPIDVVFAIAAQIAVDHSGANGGEVAIPLHKIEETISNCDCAYRMVPADPRVGGQPAIVFSWKFPQTTLFAADGRPLV